MASKPTFATVEEYLDSQTPERRTALEAVRKVIKKNLGKGFEEGIQYGMIGYYVPHKLFPAGYHCDPKQPLPFVHLASQKSYMSLYLMPVYMSSELASTFQAEWKKTGKKLDMGAACVRFKKAEDLALDAIGNAIKRMPVAKWVECYQSKLDTRGTKPKKPKR